MRRASELKRVSLSLGGQTKFTAENFFDLASNKKRAEEQLYDLIEGDRTLKAVMAKHGATRQTLEGVYRHLIMAGAGQWARGHWIAASALAYGSTLDFVLEKLASENARGREISNSIVLRLIDYFAKGAVGAIR
jgi:hypothetical protein